MIINVTHTTSFNISCDPLLLDGAVHVAIAMDEIRDETTLTAVFYAITERMPNLPISCLWIKEDVDSERERIENKLSCSRPVALRVLPKNSGAKGYRVLQNIILDEAEAKIVAQHAAVIKNAIRACLRELDASQATSS